jgi:hypothetical protein
LNKWLKAAFKFSLLVIFLISIFSINAIGPEGAPSPQIIVNSKPSSITLGEKATIMISGKNDGGDSPEAYFSISFPDNPKNVRIVSYNSPNCNVNSKGAIKGGGYGTAKFTLEYPLAECWTGGLFGTPWAGGIEYQMTVEVTPEKTGTFYFFVKMTAKDPLANKWLADPSSSNTKDQQNEYVWVYTIDVTSETPSSTPTPTPTTTQVKPAETTNATISLSGISKSYPVGSTINVNVYVMNIGGTNHTFPVGISLKDPLGNWIDLPPKTITLYPGTGGYVYFTYDIPIFSTTGIWIARTAVYNHDAGNGNLQIRYDYKEQTFNVITAPTTTPTTPVDIHCDKCNVTLGEEISITFSAVNLITNPNMTVQFILIVPSGMSVTSTGWVTDGLGQYTSNYSLKPGDGKGIAATIKSNQIGDFAIKGRVVYYFEGNKSKNFSRLLDLPVNVTSVEPTSAQPKPTISPTISDGFDAIFVIFGLLIAFYFIGRRLY